MVKLNILKGFIRRCHSVAVKGRHQRRGIGLRGRVLGQLCRHGDDERRRLVTCVDDEVPYFVAHIDLLALIMVKLRADGSSCCPIGYRHR